MAPALGRALRAAAVTMLLGACVHGGWVAAQGTATDQGGRTVVRSNAEAGPPWAALTVEQQRALGPLRSEWSSIDAARKQKWLDVASRMASMNQTERSRIQQRMTEWVRMSPTERGQARLQFQEARKVAPGNRGPQWEAYQALPPDQRRALAAKAEAARKAPASSGSPPARGPVARKQLAPTDTQLKRNVVPFLPPAAAVATPRQVAPAVVQAKPGATTSLVTTPERPPLHQQAGLPKVNASADFVNPSTLLPRRGPQGAAVSAERPASSARR